MINMASSEMPVGVVCAGSGHQAAAPPPSAVLLRRRSANYQPNAWDYDSICSSSQQDRPAVVHGNSNNLQHSKENLKDRVRQLLLEEQDAAARLRLIDQLQNLGVAYHFEEEIKSILISISHHPGLIRDDLASTALLFRMLRGYGLPASAADMLRAFRGRDEKDVDGLISLYEASYLAFPGEAMLDQARASAMEALRQITTSSMELHHQRERVDGILSGAGLPLHWRAPRLQALWSLKQQRHHHAPHGGAGGDDDEPMGAVLRLAADDFNLVQSVHRRELERMARWWKDKGLGEEKLPFARDRLVECFFCAACIAPEPWLGACREVLAKVGALIVHLDDIYDVYGTLHELAAFTDAIGRWDLNAVVAEEAAAAVLPEYMKAMYSAIVTTSVSAADVVARDDQQHNYHVLPLYKKAWHELCKAFLLEARWHYGGYKPSLNEYLNNGWITSTGPLLLLHAFPMLNLNYSSSSMMWWCHDEDGGIDYPRLVELSSRIFRLCNDSATHKAESERGDAPSAIACLMVEKSASEEGARAEVGDAIAETWKELNWEASLAAAGGWVAERMASLNLARIIHCIYNDGDAITSPTDQRKQLIKDLLFTPYK